MLFDYKVTTKAVKLYPEGLFFNDIYHLVRRQEQLFSRRHIFQCDLPLVHFFLTDYRHERHRLGIGITHLFLHLGCIRENLGTDTGSTHFRDQRQQLVFFLLAEIHEQQLRGLQRINRIKFQLV